MSVAFSEIGVKGKIDPLCDGFISLSTKTVSPLSYMKRATTDENPPPIKFSGSTNLVSLNNSAVYFTHWYSNITKTHEIEVNYTLAFLTNIIS